MSLQVMKDDFLAIQEQALTAIATASDLQGLEQVRIQYLGKKGPITEILRNVKNLDPSERPQVGALANELRKRIEEELSKAKESLEAAALLQALEDEKIDVTLPGRPLVSGTSHVLAQVSDLVEDFFIGLGYQVVEGPEVESDHYNFEMMNLPKDHPARDMQDTFYITQDYLLRTQTSPVQARTMEKHDFTKGPLKMISPGRVFRRDNDDATHSHQFMQIEGLLVDKNISLSDLKGTFDVIVKKLFGEDIETRFRPSYYQFTEPSVETDITCFACKGSGCSLCKNTGWITVSGAGMVHPNVLRNCGYDPDEWSGFAFGFGAERLAMLKYGINDIRTFYQTDLRELENFDRKED